MAFYTRTDLFVALEGGSSAARSATLTGDLFLGEECNIWFGCVLRGDDAPLHIGRRTNIQDLTMVHADPGVEHHIGEEVTVGHGCVLHGRSIGDRCLIGMGAVLLGGSEIGDECIVAAGTVVRENFKVPPRSLIAGVPGKVLREVSDEEVMAIRASAQGYVDKVKLYLSGASGA